MPSETNCWPRIIDIYLEIPEVFRGFVQPSHPFSYMIYIPEDKWGQKATNSKLILLDLNQLVILENDKGKVKKVMYLLQHINYLERGTILLYSWMSVNGIVDGKCITTTILYNSVANDIFKPVIEMLRSMQGNNKMVKNDVPSNDLSYLGSHHYKFMNYAYHALLPGQNVIGHIFQDEVYRKHLFLFFKILTPSHLCMLTNNELIIIRDESVDELVMQKPTRYGGIWNYIPLSKIKNTVTDINQDNMLSWQLVLEESECKLAFTIDSLEELRCFELELEALVNVIKQ